MAKGNHEIDGSSGKLLVVGAAVGLLAVAGGIEVARRQLAIPKVFNEKRVATFRKGAVILSAAALALERGNAMTFAQIEEWTELNSHNVSWGVNFLEERGLANRQEGFGKEVDHIWAAESLMTAALSLPEYPFLRDAMQQIAELHG